MDEQVGELLVLLLDDAVVEEVVDLVLLFVEKLVVLLVDEVIALLRGDEVVEEVGELVALLAESWSWKSVPRRLWTTKLSMRSSSS